MIERQVQTGLILAPMGGTPTLLKTLHGSARQPKASSLDLEVAICKYTVGFERRGRSAVRTAAQPARQSVRNPPKSARILRRTRQISPAGRQFSGFFGRKMRSVFDIVDRKLCKINVLVNLTSGTPPQNASSRVAPTVFGFSRPTGPIQCRSRSSPHIASSRTDYSWLSMRIFI